MSVYVLRDPRDGRARYVGQAYSPQRRLREHGHKGASPRVRAWIEELAAVGKEPALEVMKDGTEGEWIERLAPDLNDIEDGRHGGSRANAGRPKTTGSRSTPIVSFRLSASEQADLRREAAEVSLMPSALAAFWVRLWLKRQKSDAGTK